MKVFATRYLEPMKPQTQVPVDEWAWKPTNADANRLYASGGNTSSRETTYAAEKDNRSDTDRPNEGMLIA